MKINKSVIGIILLYFFYSLIGIVGKYNAVTSPIGSLRFLILLGVQLIGLVIFTVAWQLLLKIFDLSYAYLFKGTTILWSMLLAKIVFGEVITLNNVTGSVLIIIGIGVVLYEQ